MKKNKIKYFVLGGLTALSVGVYGSVKYFYNYAIKSGEKSFMSSEEASGMNHPERFYKDWDFLKINPMTWSLTSRDDLKLKAEYLKNPQQNQAKTPTIMILVHGYTSRGTLLEDYAKMFYNLGYDLLIPDLRGHGRSEGDYIGFGWPDRLDIVDWIHKIIDKYHGNVNIGLWGISMGGATVMMTSGEQLPRQVKLIIEDCGYSSTKDELDYQLKEQFKLPSFPIEPMTSAYVDYKDNYNFEESSSVKQLEKNHLPILFIHGEADEFVPYWMMQKCVDATRGPKEVYSVPKAHHAKSYEQNPQKYTEIVKGFIDKYI